MLLLVIGCAPILSGCTTLGLSDTLTADANLSRSTPSIIRSQSSVDPQESLPFTARPVTADYSPLRANADASDENRSILNSEEDVAPTDSSGHSFVQRRARLGRPIPLPEEPPTPGESASPAGSAITLPGDAEFKNFGWQPVPKPASSEDSSTINGDRNDESPSSEVDPSVNEDASTSPGSNPAAETARNMEAASTESSRPENAVPMTKEPTVFDRLRGLYVPRRDETPSERGRKTPRRWTDPFGVFRERESEIEPTEGEATTPISGNTEPETPEADRQGSNATVPVRQDLLEPLIRQMEQELSEWPRSSAGLPENQAEWLRRQTDLRMLYLIDGQSAKSIQVIESLPEKEQEFWQSMMLAMELYRRNSTSIPRTDELTETLEYVRTASRQLQSLSKMRIRRLNFCNRIDGFGAFNAFPTSDFNAGQPLLLYAEIENYQSEQTTDGQYRSNFAALIEFVRDGETEPISSRTIRLREIEDLCSSERTDYYHSYELTVPSLSPGKYRLRLRVRDQLSQQTATTELPFEIRPLGSSQ